MWTRNVSARSMTTPAPDPELEGFLALLATRRAPRTVDAYRRDLAQLSAWRQGPVGETTTEELERWLAELRAAGISASTVARRIAALRSFFRHQMLLGARDDNPAAALALPPPAAGPPPPPPPPRAAPASSSPSSFLSFSLVFCSMSLFFFFCF